MNLTAENEFWIKLNFIFNTPLCISKLDSVSFTVLYYAYNMEQIWMSLNVYFVESEMAQANRKTYRFKLIYFEERGSVDLIKLLFKLANEPYEDVQIKVSEWNAYKVFMPVHLDFLYIRRGWLFNAAFYYCSLSSCLAWC